MSDAPALLERLLGAPVACEELKHKAGRRRTMRAVGSSRRAIVKVYRSDRAATVARRIRALEDGPDEPTTPHVLAVDERAHSLVLTEVPGTPLRVSLLARDTAACARVGAALARWHRYWRIAPPETLTAHPADREIALLLRWADRTSPGIAAVVREDATALGSPWRCSTVVHRDLYEEQVMLHRRVGLIDLDDAAVGPPELDVANLWAHVDLLGVRAGTDLSTLMAVLADAYEAAGAPLDSKLLRRCWRLSRLRLACIHTEPRLLPSGRRDGSHHLLE